MCPGHFHADEDSKKSFVQGCLETSDQAAQETDLRLQLLKVVVEGQDEWNNSTDGDDLLPLCPISCCSKWLQDVHQRSFR